MKNDYSDEKDINRRCWGASVAISADTEGSAGYNVKGSLAGARDLYPIELWELSGVSGLSLLHLQAISAWTP